MFPAPEPDLTSIEGDDLEREIEEFNKNRIKDNLQNILTSVNYPDIEDIVTEN